MNTINIAFPLKDDKEKNSLFATNVVTKDALSSNLMLLLLTDKGERYYHPDYGTDLKKFIFEPNDQVTISSIQKDIKDTVKKYIPQLTINNIEFYTNEVDDNNDPLMDNEIKVVINFNYEENTFSDGGKLELSFKK